MSWSYSRTGSSLRDAYLYKNGADQHYQLGLDYNGPHGCGVIVQLQTYERACWVACANATFLPMHKRVRQDEVCLYFSVV